MSGIEMPFAHAATLTSLQHFPYVTLDYVCDQCTMIGFTFLQKNSKYIFEVRNPPSPTRIITVNH